MVRQKALAYIRKNKAANFEDAEIRKALEIAGWPKEEIDLAFIEAQSRVSSTHIGSSPARKDSATESGMGSAMFSQGNVVVENMWKRKAEGSSFEVAPKRAYKFLPVLKKVSVIFLGLALLGGVVGGGYWYYSVNLAPSSLRVASIRKVSEYKQINYDLRVILRARDGDIKIASQGAEFMPQFGGVFVGMLEPKKENLDDVEKIEINVKRVADWRDAALMRENLSASLNLTEYLGSNFTYESRRFGDSLYFRLADVPEKLPTIFGFDLVRISSSTLEGVWVALDTKTISKDYGEFVNSLRPIDSSLEKYVAESTSVPQTTQTPTDDMNLITKSLATVRWEKETFQETVREKISTRYKGVGGGEMLSLVSRLAGSNTSDDQLKKLQTASDPSGTVEVNMWVEKSTGTIVQISVHALPPDNQSSGFVELTALVAFHDAESLDGLVEPTGVHTIQDVTLGSNRILHQGFEAARSEKRDEVRKTDLEKIQQALGLYLDMYKRYPDTLATLVPEFLAVVPKDPLTQKNYQYKKSGTKNFTLVAQFENKQ